MQSNFIYQRQFLLQMFICIKKHMYLLVVPWTTWRITQFFHIIILKYTLIKQLAYLIEEDVLVNFYKKCIKLFLQLTSSSSRYEPKTLLSAYKQTHAWTKLCGKQAFLCISKWMLFEILGLYQCSLITSKFMHCTGQSWGQKPQRPDRHKTM
jgi:hypothetical protein